MAFLLPLSRYSVRWGRIQQAVCQRVKCACASHSASALGKGHATLSASCRAIRAARASSFTRLATAKASSVARAPGVDDLRAGGWPDTDRLEEPVEHRGQRPDTMRLAHQPGGDGEREDPAAACLGRLGIEGLEGAQ